MNRSGPHYTNPCNRNFASPLEQIRLEPPKLPSDLDGIHHVHDHSS